MAGAFRDDLEAARARAEALAEENEAMRAEISELRRRTALAPGAPSGARPHEDPELAKLAERTLERLDHLIEAPVGPPDEEPPPASAPAAPATNLRHLSPPRPSEQAHDDQPRRALASSREIDARHLSDRLAVEREELRRLSRYAARMFWVGLAVGGVAGALLATLLR